MTALEIIADSPPLALSWAVFLVFVFAMYVARRIFRSEEQEAQKTLLDRLHALERDVKIIEHRKDG